MCLIKIELVQIEVILSDLIYIRIIFLFFDCIITILLIYLFKKIYNQLRIKNIIFITQKATSEDMII